MSNPDASVANGDAWTQTVFVASVYFAQGVVPGLSLGALTDYLTAGGAPLPATSQLAFWVGIPWTLSFVWGPVIDNVHLGRLPRRAGWIFAMAIAGAAALAIGMAVDVASDSITYLALAFATHSVFASIIDASTDALVVEMTPPDQVTRLHAWGRGGMLAGTAVAAALFASMLPRFEFQMIVLTLMAMWTLPFAIAMACYRWRWENDPTPTSSEDTHPTIVDANDGGEIQSGDQTDGIYAEILIANLFNRQSLLTALGFAGLYAVYTIFRVLTNYDIIATNPPLQQSFTQWRSGVDFLVSISMIFVAQTVLIRWTTRRQTIVTVATTAGLIGLCVAMMFTNAATPAAIVVYAAFLSLAKLLLYLTACRHFASLSVPLTAGAQFTAYMALLNIAEVGTNGIISRLS